MRRSPITLIPPVNARAPDRSIVDALLLAGRICARWGLILAPGVIVGVLVARPLITDRSLPDSADLYAYFYQIGLSLQRAYTQGQLPFWNPSVLSGAPLLADPGSAALYPPNVVLLRMLNVVDALRAMLVLHVLIAYLGTYAFLRSIRIGQAASVYGALSYAFSGYVFSRLLLLPLLMLAALLPVLFLFTERSLRGISACHRAGAAMGLACAVALDMLVGFAQGTYYSLLALVAYVLCTTLQRKAFASPGALLIQAREIAVRAGLPILLGIVACSAQLLPAVEFVRATNLSEAYAGAVTNGGLLRADLWALVGAGRETTENRSLYIGSLALGLAILAVVRRPNRYTLFFGGTSLLVPLLSTESRTPIRALASWALPGWSSFDTHVPARAMFLVVFALAVLGACVLDRPRLLLPWFPLLAMVEVGVILLLPAIAAGTADIVPPTGAAAADGLRFVALFLSAGSIAIFGAWTIRRWLVARRLMVPCLIALLIADLTVHDRSLQIQFIPFSNIFTASPTADFLAQQQPTPFRIAAIPQPTGWAEGYVDRGTIPTLLSSGAATVYGFQDAQGYNPLQLMRYRDFLQAVDGSGLIDYHVGVIRNPLSPLLRYLNVRFLIADPAARPSVQMAGWRELDATQPVSEAFMFTQPIDEVVFNSTLTRSTRVPQGTPVGALDVTSDDGTTNRFLVRAGIDTAEIAYDEPEVRKVILHDRPPIARSWPAGPGYEDHVYVGAVRLPRPTKVTRLGFELLDTTLTWTIEQASSGEQSWPDSDAVVFEGPGVKVFDAADTLPRAFVAPSVVQARDGAAALARMQDSSFDPRRAVVVEENPDPIDARLGSPLVSNGQWAAAEATTTSDSGAEYRVNEPNRIVVDVHTPQPAMLVMSEQFYPAWQAYVDDQPAHIYRADDILRAVAVPTGSHTVEMRYESETFRVGLLVSVITVLVLLPAAAWLIWATDQHRLSVTHDTAAGRQPNGA